MNKITEYVRLCYDVIYFNIHILKFTLNWPIHNDNSYGAYLIEFTIKLYNFPKVVS